MLSKLPKYFLVKEGLLLYKEFLHNKDCLLAYLKLDFKHVILSHLDELLSVSYMDGKLEMSSFQPN
jgi:hypothetical protein